MADASAPSGAEAPPAEVAHRFSLACFPLERVLVLVGMMAGPAMAAVVFWQYERLMATASDSRVTSALDAGQGRLFAGLTALLAIVLVVFGALYLQMRAGTRILVASDRLRVERAALLPFGLLGRRRELPWAQVRRTELTRRRSWMGVSRPTLEIAAPHAVLRLSVADAWPEPGPPRPWFPREPQGGWTKHPLVEAATTTFAAAALGARSSPSSHVRASLPFKSETDRADE